MQIFFISVSYKRQCFINIRIFQITHQQQNKQQINIKNFSVRRLIAFLFI